MRYRLCSGWVTGQHYCGFSGNVPQLAGLYFAGEVIFTAGMVGAGSWYVNQIRRILVLNAVIIAVYLWFCAFAKLL